MSINKKHLFCYIKKNYEICDNSQIFVITFELIINKFKDLHPSQIWSVMVKVFYKKQKVINK